MSKMDAQRAMREANWAARQKKAGEPAPRRTVRPAATPSPTAAAKPAASEPAAAPATAADEACGHRSMNGRTCTRPAGHAEKNHRYG